MPESLRILKELICLNSENPPGNTRANIEWINTWAKINNIPAEIQWYEEDKGNIILSFGDSDKSIILCGHLDTVPIGDLNNWFIDPLGAIEKNGYIYGRGAADMKGGIAACLGALKRVSTFNKTDFEYKIIFLGTSDEEVGLTGAQVANDSEIMKSAEFLLVAEPTELKVGIAEKGVLWLSIHSYGKAAHGSTPEKGVNAIEKLTELFPILHLECPEDIDPILGKSTLNIGVINGGKSANVVPEYAEVHCDYRLVPPYKPKDFADKIYEKIKTFSSGNSAKIEMKVNQIMPSVSSSRENYFVQRFVRKCHFKRFIGLNYGTDAAVLADQQPPIPFVIFGPGDPKIIHAANERISISELLRAESILTEFLIDISLSNK